MKAYLDKIDEVISKGKYKDTWESLQQYRVPEWYGSAKFGIFIMLKVTVPGALRDGGGAPVRHGQIP